ncbi:hypothetical protein EXN66_Car000266 [Channa argus]|uniref:Uncharacterized protein n=1 Tax=Channa argus TaxID=215402 RepID=A0A6G1QXR0_CHAAH|nr:hypothetical protein EXN66_Car000266 [Channa argus]
MFVPQTVFVSYNHCVLSRLVLNIDQVDQRVRTVLTGETLLDFSVGSAHT